MKGVRVDRGKLLTGTCRRADSKIHGLGGTEDRGGACRWTGGKRIRAAALESAR